MEKVNVKVKLLIDNKPYTSKPDSKETACIKIRLAKPEALKGLTINEFCEYIGKGYTFIPSVLQNGTKNENWVQQQLFGLDVDNETDGEILTPEEAITLLNDKGISVFAYYHTFNSSEVKPKFRLLFLLKEATCNQGEAKFIIETLISLLPQADKSCKDLSRLFYGTNKEIKIVDPEARITLEDIIKVAKPKTEAKTDYKASSDLKPLIEKYDLEKYMIEDGNEVCGSSSSWTYFKNCKICGHNNCLRYHKNTNTFYCFGANGNKGGNIINYLMITKKLTSQEAVNCFKYKLLGMEKPLIDPLIELKAKDLEIVKNQVEKNSLDSNIIKQLEWVQYGKSAKGDKLMVKILCPELANFIRNNVNYFFVRNNAKSGILRYVYLNGYYKLVSDEELKGIIVSFIPSSLLKMKDVIEVFKILETDLKFVPIDKLNTDQNIINFENGILDLSTGELKPHSPDYLCTIRIPCNYKKNVPVPKNRYFSRFLNNLTNNNPKVKRLILQVMGVALSNIAGHKMKQALFMVRSRKYRQECY